jgi:homoserine dehydrogenase
LLNSRANWFKAQGTEINVTAIVDRNGAAIAKKGINLSKALETKKLKGSVSNLKDSGKPNYSALEVLEDIDSDIVIEATSTNFQTGEPGLTHIKTALRLGKNVVTTNKGSIAKSFTSLINLAQRHSMKLKFSGAVGGALPILDFAKKCLIPEDITSIRGVLNGTTNHILWSMAEKHIELPQAMQKAQELGYAEENIRYDLEGLDTACKLVIIANWIMNRKITLEDVETHGIQNISLEEILDAKRKGYLIRLIGSIKKKTKVSPERILTTDPICVNSALNAVAIDSKYSGQHIIIGKGAGGKETASSIIKDIIEIIQEYKPYTLRKDYLTHIPSENEKYKEIYRGIKCLKQ